ncbi:hypothetical protein M2145_002545 [Lachnospiraceae bacterium PF1-21]
MNTIITIKETKGHQTMNVFNIVATVLSIIIAIISLIVSIYYSRKSNSKDDYAATNSASIKNAKKASIDQRTQNAYIDNRKIDNSMADNRTIHIHTETSQELAMRTSSKNEYLQKIVSIIILLLYLAAALIPIFVNFENIPIHNIGSSFSIPIFNKVISFIVFGFRHATKSISLTLMLASIIELIKHFRLRKQVQNKNSQIFLCIFNLLTIAVTALYYFVIFNKIPDTDFSSMFFVYQSSNPLFSFVAFLVFICFILALFLSTSETLLRLLDKSSYNNQNTLSFHDIINILVSSFLLIATNVICYWWYFLR